MTDAERQRLAAILGMLGSDQPGERAAAALKAEAFRKKHGLTWAELVAMPTPIVAAPEPPPWTPPPPPEPPKPDPFEYAPWTPPDLTPWTPPRPYKAGGWANRSAAIALGAIPIIIVLASLAPKIRQALGY